MERIKKLALDGRLRNLPWWFEIENGIPQFGVWLTDWTAWNSTELPDGGSEEKLTAVIYIDGKPYKEALIYEIWNEDGELTDWWIEELRDP